MLNQFTFNFKEIVIDEIALEGLNGITLELLWRRLEKRTSTSLTEKIKARIWNFVIGSKEISFYRLPEPRARFEIIDRFTVIDEETGHLKDPDDYPDGPYEYCPVKEDYGSCKDYATRELLEKSDKLLLEHILQYDGDSLVLVASLTERWRSLAPQLPISMLETIPPERYCMLELIGKGRENGQMSVGKSNLLKLSKDPKLLFYNRKPMKQMDLITSVVITQRCSTKANKAILIRLTRFHKSRLASQPKEGKHHNLIQYLKMKPNFSESVDTMLKDKILTAKQVKKIKKSTTLIILYEETPATEKPDKPAKSKRLSAGPNRRLTLTLESGESSDSDGESLGAAEVQCQYKVGITLLRQAYERILDSGLKGLSQLELGQTLGIGFYTSRTIARVFKKRKIVREFVSDTGRKRTTRFIAVAATGVADKQYAQEKQQLLDYLNTTNDEPAHCDLPNNSLAPNTSKENKEVPMKKKKLKSEDSEAVPRKKIKLQVDDHDTSAVEEPDAITEVKTIVGQENVKGYSASFKEKGSGPTMRQLKFANGIIKVTREKGSVTGFYTLSHLVAKEINENAMDSKALKTFVQKLVADGQLKVYTLKWPGKNKYTSLICAPHVQITDPIVQTKYKEICMRSIVTTRQKTKGRPSAKLHQPLSLLVYPRYMKVRQLHLFLVQTVFSSEGIQGSDMPPGFFSLVQIIPEMPVELAIGLMSAVATTPLMHAKLTDTFMKSSLKDIPMNIYSELLQSRSLQNSLRENLRILATFGLVQMCHKIMPVPDKWLLQNVFYMNRNAKVIDTTGTWPREDADPSSLERRFRFDTYDDALAYWTTLYEVSINTHVVGRIKTRTCPAVPLRDQGEVSQYDDGRMFGDGRGAGGVDSMYYIDLQRNWETLNIVNFKPILVKTDKREKKLKPGPKAKPPSLLKPRKPKARRVARIKREPKKRVPLEMGRKRRRALPMGTWEPWEDEIIMLCKTGMTIMSPNSQPGCLSVRNMVAKDILGIHDKAKVGNLCHRRAVTLEPDSILAHTSECLLNEVRRRKQTMAKYGGLLKKLRIAHSVNMAKYIKVARVPLMELVMILYKILRSESFNKITPCVARNLGDFHKDFTITTATSNRPLNLYRAPSECDIPVLTIKEAVVMALALKIEGDLDEATTRKVYNILGEYPEKHIRLALEHLRKSGMIAAKEKMFNAILSRLTFEDTVQFTSTYQATVATYRLSASYARHMICKLETGFGDDLARACDKPLPNPVNACAEEICTLLERHAAGLVELVTLAVPSVCVSSSRFGTVETMDSSLKLTTGSVGWKQTGMPLKESEDCYETHLQTLVRAATIPKPKNKYPKDELLIDILEKRKDKGATFMELRELSGLHPTALGEKLNQLASKSIIARVGFYENYIVLSKYAEPWSVNLGDSRLIPTPWLTLGDFVNKPVFVKWCGVIVNTIFNCPGMSIAVLANHCEAITAMAVQEICEFLEKCKCVKFEVIREVEPDLFSGEEFAAEYDVFTKFESPSCIIVLPTRDALTRFATIRKNILAAR